MTQGASDESTFEELSAGECLVLLSERSVGRFAVGAPGSSPLVVPVNYMMDGDAVVFRTGPGQKFDALGGQPVSFQLDEIDPSHHTGWSVLVKGKAYEATHWETDHLTIEPWAPGRKDRWVRIVPDEITGRRIRLAPFEPDPRAYL